MNKFNIGDEVLFEGNLGIVRDTDKYSDENMPEEWEYAVEFYDPDGIENLFGCSNSSFVSIIDTGKGAWLLEENLEAVNV